jgi:hypothetical protein
MAVAADNADNIYVGQFCDGRVREVVAGPALSITSTRVSGAVSKTATIGPISVGEEDHFGNPIAAPSGGTTIALASSSPTGFSAATSGGASTTQLVIPAGASAATFYYGDSSAGSPWLTTLAAGYGTGAQQTTINGPTTAPLNIQATAGQAQATVAWAQSASDGGSPITSYAVTASPGGATCSQSGPSGGQCTVSGLIDGTTYTFTVTAANAIGTSPPSAPSSPVVPRSVPGVPRSVSAVAGNDSAIVSFQPPTSDGAAAITAYTATATDLTNPANGNQAATGSTSPLTLTGLAVGDQYTFSVAGPVDLYRAAAGHRDDGQRHNCRVFPHGPSAEVMPQVFGRRCP